MIIDLIKSLGVAVVYLIDFEAEEESLRKLEDEEDAKIAAEKDELEYKAAA